jgi:L-lysine 2,3-aminomutase
MTRLENTKRSICSVKQLKPYLSLSSAEETLLKKITQIHPMRISQYYLSLIDWSDPDDPIRKMAVPSVEELSIEGLYDTSGEADNSKMQGLQHKYRETALILATNELGCRLKRF